MKKFLKITAIVIVTLAVLIYGYLEYSTAKNNAAPTEAALAALESPEGVDVRTEGNWLILKPEDGEPDTALIFYPGAYCDIRGYAQLLTEIAAAGYLVIAVEMPFDFSIFGRDSADAVRAAFPDIRNWVMAGHSMGGAMAGSYSFSHQDELAGLILWDSYSSQSLGNSSLPVTHIHRALPDGTSSTIFSDKRDTYPKDVDWIPVPGGNHMQFGSFSSGSYQEEWDPQISEDAQHRIIIDATIAALDRMSR